MANWRTVLAEALRRRNRVWGASNDEQLTKMRRETRDDRAQKRYDLWLTKKPRTPLGDGGFVTRAR